MIYVKNSLCIKKSLPVIFLLLFLLLIPSGAFSQDESAFQKPEGEQLARLLSDFEAYAEKGMDDWGTPGMAIAIVCGDEVIYSKAFGVKTLGKDDPVTEETLFQIGSTSKAFTSALVSMLEDEGKFGWKDPVRTHLPDFMMYDPWVTEEFLVQDLMAQHSGLAPYAGDMQSSVGFDRAHIINSLRYIKPVNSFRSDYAYQNSLFLVAAQLVEKYTDKTWEENIKERILTPLGMDSTTTDLKSFTEGENSASLHLKLKGEIKSLPSDWPFHYWPYTYGPAGGINSNIIDMAQWLKFQANNGNFEGKQLISEENMFFMHSPKTTAAMAKEHNQYYCLAWVYRENNPFPIIWHNGGTSGCKTMVALVPDAKLGIVVLSNYADSNLPDALAYRFFDMYFGNPERDWSGEMLETQKKTEEAYVDPVPPENPSPPLSPNAYTGDYSNDIFGTVNIEEKENSLFMTIGPKKVEFSLKHWNRDTFYFTIPDIEETPTFVTFTMDKDGMATEFVIESIYKEGCGIFEKVNQEE